MTSSLSSIELREAPGGSVPAAQPSQRDAVAASAPESPCWEARGADCGQALRYLRASIVAAQQLTCPSRCCLCHEDNLTYDRTSAQRASRAPHPLATPHRRILQLAPANPPRRPLTPAVTPGWSSSSSFVTPAVVRGLDEGSLGRRLLSFSTTPRRHRAWHTSSRVGWRTALLGQGSIMAPSTRCKVSILGHQGMPLEQDEIALVTDYVVK